MKCGFVLPVGMIGHGGKGVKNARVRLSLYHERRASTRCFILGGTPFDTLHTSRSTSSSGRRVGRSWTVFAVKSEF